VLRGMNLVDAHVYIRDEYDRSIRDLSRRNCVLIYLWVIAVDSASIDCYKTRS